MSAKYKYKAFLSYSHADEKWASWLHKSLETYHTPKRLVGRKTVSGVVPARLTPVFRDREELASSAELSERIESALRESENLVVICSPSAARSRWVSHEVEVFKKLGRSERIFCMIVAGDPAAKGAENDCFPPSIRQLYDAKGALLDGEAEPMAADPRGNADGKALARLKILAGLLDVDLDQLRQREQNRRQRKMIALTGASLLATAFATVLTLNAMMARTEAEQRRLQAESLLEFMVVDLRDRLAPLGRLDLLESVNQKAMSYFSAVDIKTLSDDELTHQTRVITQIGEIRFEQLKYSDALDSFLDAYRRSSILLANAPDDGERLFNRCQAEFWVGYVHWMRADREKAGKWLHRYLASSTQLAQQHPDNLQWRKEVAYGHHNLGALFRETDELELSEQHFSDALAIYSEIQGKAGSDELRSEVADAVSYLGDIYQMKGDLQKALDYYRRNADEHRALSENDRNNKTALDNLATSLLLLSEAYALVGETTNAQSVLDDTLAITELLVTTDNSNIAWLGLDLEARTRKGYLLYAESRHIDAEASIDRVHQALATLEGDNLIDMFVRNVTADSWRLKAAIEFNAGDYANALQSTEKALLQRREVVTAGWSGEVPRGRLANIYILRAEILRSGNDPEEAAKSLQRAAEILQFPVSDKASHHLLDPWSRYLILTGQHAEAVRVIQLLAKRRYQPLIPWPAFSELGSAAELASKP